MNSSEPNLLPALLRATPFCCFSLLELVGSCASHVPLEPMPLCLPLCNGLYVGPFFLSRTVLATQS